MGCGGSKAAVADSSAELHIANRRVPPAQSPAVKDTSRSHAAGKKAAKQAAADGHSQPVSSVKRRRWGLLGSPALPWWCDWSAWIFLQRDIEHSIYRVPARARAQSTNAAVGCSHPGPQMLVVIPSLAAADRLLDLLKALQASPAQGTSSPEDSYAPLSDSAVKVAVVVRALTLSA